MKEGNCEHFSTKFYKVQQKCCLFVSNDKKMRLYSIFLLSVSAVNQIEVEDRIYVKVNRILMTARGHESSHKKTCMRQLQVEM